MKKLRASGLFLAMILLLTACSKEVTDTVLKESKNADALGEVIQESEEYSEVLTELEETSELEGMEIEAVEIENDIELFG